METRSQIKDLADVPEHTEPVSDGEPITVSPATKRIAFAYERFRNTLEPEEADILRRKAIVRILERRLAENRPSQVAAEQILQELIRANYIPPVTKAAIPPVALRLEKIEYIRHRLDPNMLVWFLNIAAVSIDRMFYPWTRQEGLISLMYQDVYKRTEWIDDLVESKDRPTQTYIACHRALFEADDYEISYHYFLHYFPEWNANDAHEKSLQHIVQELPSFYGKLSESIDHAARERLTRMLRPPAVPYRIIGDLLKKKDAEIFETPEALEVATREAVTKRAQKLRSSMGKRAWHSVLFLFFTKTILAFLLEVPYELLAVHGVHWFALSINIAFHPFLLLFLTTSVRLPGNDNTNRIADQVQKIITGEGELPTIVVRKSRGYGAMTWTIFALFYLVLFLIIFWGIFSLLELLEFSLVAMFMFVMFLGLVSFLAIRIRRSVNQLRLVPAHEGAVSIFVTFLSLPVLEFGRWLAQNIKQLNVALFFMDRILEAPFKILIDITEEWFDFVRDRQEEIT
jgi:hypothetical protein